MKTILLDAWVTFVTKEDGIFKEIHELLEQYPNPKIIVTNATDEEMPQFGIVDMPYEVYTMSHNPNKTDPKYFEALMEKYNLKPEDVVYYERNEESVKAAKSLGITTYLYDPEKKDLDGLKRFLDENL